MMKKLIAILFFYMLTAVLLLPFAVTFLCGGFRVALPQEAKAICEMEGEVLPYEMETAV